MTDLRWFRPTGWATAHLLRDGRRFISGSAAGGVTVCGRTVKQPLGMAVPSDRLCGQCKRRSSTSNEETPDA